MKANKKYQEIGKFLVFSFHDLKAMPYFIHAYIIKNEDKLTKLQCYQLGIVGSEFTYQIAYLKSRISSGKSFTGNIKLNNDWIKVVCEYDHLIDFMIDKFITDFQKLDSHTQSLYILEDKYSYFNTSDEIKISLLNGIKKIKFD